MEWSKKHFPNNRKKIDELMTKLKELQSMESNDGTKKLVKECEEELEKAWIKEERFWLQRSRIKWLWWGDRNTKFFHQRTLMRRQRNRVTRLKDENGLWLEEEERIAKRINSYFQKLFTTNGDRSWGNTMDAVEKVVTEDMNEHLTAEIQDEEIKRAVFQMNALKALGPDGFNGLFFQKYGDTVKEDVIKAVKGFFQSGHMLAEMNNTNMVLIPKVHTSEEVTQFRPIGLCNFVYKIIAKIMVNRMKSMLDSLISENQTAFVPKRLIHDNIIIAHKCFHHLKRKEKGKKGEFGLKIDMNKAYDRVE